MSILENLGFHMLDRESVITNRVNLAHPRNRAERRRLKKEFSRMRYRPWFTRTSDCTIATDADGNSWVGPPNIDLSVHGFNEKTDVVLAQCERIFTGATTH